MANEYYWLQVSKDEYELPLFVADSAAELAKHMGVKTNSVISLYKNYEQGRVKNCYVRRVDRERPYVLDFKQKPCEVIKEMIYESGLNAQQIHEITGISVTQIRSAVTGKSDPRLSTLIKIAAACGYSKIVFKEEQE